MRPLYFQRDPNGIPRLRNADIETAAETMVYDYRRELLSVPQELDIEHFVEYHLGLKVDYKNLSNSGFIWGCMVFDNIKIPVYDPDSDMAYDCPIDARTIVVDNGRLCQSKEHTYRMTVAHEGGHWVFHQPVYRLVTKNGCVTNRARGFSSCSQSDITRVNTRKHLTTENDWLEHQAKYFASALLMPKTSVETLRYDPSTEMRINSWLLHDTAAERNHVLVSAVSEAFNVSRMAARIRLEQLGLMYQPTEDELKRRKTCWSPYEEVKQPVKPKEVDIDVQIEAYFERLYQRMYG